MTTKAGIGAMGVGMVAGAIAALLYAPQAGHKSRRDIRRKGSQFYQEIEANYGRACDKTSSLIRSVRRQGKRYVSFINGLGLPVVSR
jgi:gas vesicle protein